MDKPREFWILKDDVIRQYVVMDRNPGKYADQYTHVIEYAAVEKLIKCIEKQFNHIYCGDMRTGLAVEEIKEALARFKEREG